MKKNFVLDTNVLLHDPNAIFHFEDNNVCVPIYVIEEVDKFKKQLNELGRNAREFRKKVEFLVSIYKENLCFPIVGLIFSFFAPKRCW